MSKRYLECPLVNHESCRERDNPMVCAIVREDKICLKSKGKQESDRDTFCFYRIERELVQFGKDVP